MPRSPVLGNVQMKGLQSFIVVHPVPNGNDVPQHPSFLVTVLIVPASLTLLSV